MRKAEINIKLELAYNGAIIRCGDDDGYQHVEVVEGKIDKVVECIGKYIISQMNYDDERKAKNNN